MKSISYSDMTDLQECIKKINEYHKEQNKLIKDHFENISSNPANMYNTNEQLSVIIEIMKCYNINIIEYQKNIRDLTVITRNILLNAQNNETNIKHKTLYEYFIDFLFGTKDEITSKDISKNIEEPIVDLENIFMNNDIIEYNRDSISENSRETLYSAHTIGCIENEIIENENIQFSKQDNQSQIHLDKNIAINSNTIKTNIIKRRHSQPIIKHLTAI